MEIIRSIFAFYNLDMAVHNSYPVENPEEQQVDGDEEVAGADIADDTRLQAGEVEGDEVRAEAQALGDEPAEKDNVSEDEFAAGEQEGHIEELFLNISDDIEGTYAGDKGLDEGGFVPVADGGDKAPDDDDGTDLLLPDPEAPLNLEQYKDVEQRTKDVEKRASYIEHVTKSKKRATLAGEKEQRKSKRAKIMPRRFLD